MSRTKALGVVLLGIAWAAGCSTSDGVPGAKRGGAASTTSGESAGGLPCDVEQLLGARCTSCHSAKATRAPMALVTYADLLAPSKTEPSKSVARLALERMTDKASPMPPSSPLAGADIATFEKWVSAGTPQSTCEVIPIATRDASSVECVLASDCPGELVCKSGVCDVECVSNKDCYATWTCEETRCHPPAESGPTLPDAGAPVTYSDFTSSAPWTTYNLAGITSSSYSGAVFDGRYTYFAPDNGSGLTLRYDSKTAFTSVRSWSTFDLTGLNAAAKSFRGATYDGRYVYFVPAGSGPIARYDTQAKYLDAAAWTLFDLKTVNGSVGFTGAAFDGRYLYLAPAWGGAAMSFRYDTEGAFTSAASWSTFSIATVDARVRSFVGAVFDGRHVYFIPSSGATGPQGLLARYDTEAAFNQVASWKTLDLAGLDPKAVGYRTGAFDGRFLYLVPGWTAPNPSWATSTLARFDTKADFEAREGWSFFDTTTVNPAGLGFNAAAFDGRYLVLSPGYNNTAYHGTALRYDTQGVLGSVASWSSFDGQALGAAVKNMRGIAFDGRYTYFAPSAGVALRYEARTADEPMSAASPGGSFY